MFRFHLVKDKYVEWNRPPIEILATKPKMFTRTVSIHSAEIIQSTDNNPLCAKLKELMESNISGNLEEDAWIDRSLDVEIAVDPRSNTGRSSIRLYELSGSIGKTTLTRLKIIMERYGLDMKVNIRIKNFGEIFAPVNELTSLMTEEARIPEFSSCNGVNLHCSQGWKRSLWKTENGAFEGVITITCVAFWKTCVDLVDNPFGSGVGGTPYIIRKMWKEGVGSDVTIISSEKEEIKCHKVILQGQSDVFEAMFRSTSRTQESISGTIKMDDMASKSVKAFLAFLYLDEIQDAKGDSVVALDLLKAAHKYNVPRLEERMKQLFLEKENKWFDLEVAMQLFIFARNLPAGDNLKKKATLALKVNHSQLEESSSYKQLFAEDPVGAMELCRYFVSGGPIASSSAGGTRGQRFQPYSKPSKKPT